MLTMALVRDLASRGCRVATGVLRELADEAAYDRHLAATGRIHSAAEWRSFWEERLRGKYQRAKCC